MTDTELAAYLHLSPEQAKIIIPKLTRQRRATYERMAQVEIEANLWITGLGPKPKGVLIDTIEERNTRRRNNSRKRWKLGAK